MAFDPEAISAIPTKAAPVVAPVVAAMVPSGIPCRVPWGVR